MHFYAVIVATKRQETVKTETRGYRTSEAGALGDVIPKACARPGFTSLRVRPISEATYVRLTRSD